MLGGNCSIRSGHQIPLTIAANSEFPLELGITPVEKGEFGQLFHFYLDVGNVLVTKEIEFKGVCVE